MILPQSIVITTGVRVASPIGVVVAAWLFFAGHNRPGGGFAAGLVLGAIVALRAVVGLRVPGSAVGLLAVGGLIISAVVLAPLVASEPILDQLVVTVDAPVLGTIKTGSALVFDLGVTVIVLGLIVAVLDGFEAHRLARPPFHSREATQARSAP